MKAYADTSFLVKLVTRESSLQEAMAEFRRLGLPRKIWFHHFDRLKSGIQ